VAEIIAIFGITLAVSKPKAAHGGHDHGDAHGHAAHAAGH
jgi:hypothetical protein